MPSPSHERGWRALRTVRASLRRLRASARGALRRFLLAVVNYYFHPVHAECAPRTVWMDKLEAYVFAQGTLNTYVGSNEPPVFSHDFGTWSGRHSLREER